MRIIPVHPQFFASGKAVVYPKHASQNLVAQTIMAQFAPVGSLGGAGLGRIFNYSNTASTNGQRLQMNNSTGQVAFGGSSSGSSTQPLGRTGTTGGVGDFFTIAATWDGSLTASAGGILMYKGLNEDLAVADTASTGDGSGSLNSGAGEQITIGNRGDLTARYFDGPIWWVARWNWRLPEILVQYVQIHGPLAVPWGLVFYHANNQDHGPVRMCPSYINVFSQESRVSRSYRVPPIRKFRKNWVSNFDAPAATAVLKPFVAAFG